MIFAFLFKAKFLNKEAFCYRSYQPILRYLYTEVTKRRGEISLPKHFNCLTQFPEVKKCNFHTDFFIQHVFAHFFSKSFKNYIIPFLKA